jgi:UMF1 family MFS transporter
VFLSVAVWWLVFSIPLFTRVPEPRRVRESDELDAAPVLRTALVRLGETLRELRRYRQAFLMLVAMLVYNDGITTIIRMAVLYGRQLELDAAALILAILLVQFVGFPCAFLFAWIAGKLGAKRAILLGLAVYVAITLIAWRMDSAADFYALALGVGLVQGGCQALSRSLFASMVPAHKSGEFFGLFGVLERFSSVLGPLVFGATIELTGSQRAGVLPLIAFFAGGAWLLSRVDVEAGRRAARDAEAATR